LVPSMTYTLSLHDALPIFIAEHALVFSLACPELERKNLLRAVIGVQVRAAQGRNRRASIDIPPDDGDAGAVIVFGNWLHEGIARSEEHTSELQSRENIVCR